MNVRRGVHSLTIKVHYCIAVAVLIAILTPAAHGEPLAVGTARPSPEWLRAGTVYEIFPRDFSSHGDFNGITAQLDRLKDLGVTILWTMPIHPIGEKLRKGNWGSPYSIKDYYAVDTNYGTLDDYRHLVAEAHRRGLKVIMDLVANHTAWDSVMMQHPEFYKHDAQGKVISPVPEWTDVAGLDYHNPALRHYMIEMLKYWVHACDVDGFRCDAAAMIPTDFWEQARAELMKVKPGIMMLAEASKPELLTQAFDIDYSWPLLSTVNDVVQHDASAAKIRQSWEESCAVFPKGALHLRISDDHDEPRAVGRYGPGGALAASALMFTLDGVPLIYNGMEIGDRAETAGGSLFEKLPISWSAGGGPTPDIYHDLIHLRQQYPALRNSPVNWLHNSAESHVVTFLRADAHDELLVMINFSSRAVSGTIDLKNAGGFVPVSIPGVNPDSDDPPPAFHLNGFEWYIFHRPVE